MLLSDLLQAQVVETQLAGQPRLSVTWEKRSGFGNIVPFSEAGVPPLAVFWNRMELRQMDRDDPEVVARWFGLDPGQVEAAVRYERELRAA